MLLEIGCPCALLLGYARLPEGAVAQVGVALQHPPTQVFAQAAPALAVTGPRADVAHAAAERYGRANSWPTAGQLDVELATPALTGLGSEPLLSLCALPAGPARRRAAGGHRPAPRRCTPPRLSLDTSRLVADDLWPALERDDLAAFGRALLALHAATAALLPPLHAATAALMPPLPADALTTDLLALIAGAGAAAWGQALTGHALFALVRGAEAAAALRAALTARLGWGAGCVLVTITDTTGARTARHAQRPLLP